MKKLTLAVCIGLLSTAASLPALATKHTSQHKTIATKIATSPIDINTASAVQLSHIKGIGTKKAAAIVAYRQAHGRFKSLSDLALVKGISDKTIARWQKNNSDRLVVKK